ncbi:MAG: 16S rRNA (adenine(1518)-N(6)/adenine(1519)-N(6))-dimethyltransferase RsmA [Thiohalospira sp.]
MNDTAAHRPRKRFGQNFLHDRTVIDRILDAVDPRAEEKLVEIGPGRGALTGPLLERVERLRAIEIDRDLAADLRRRFGDRLELVEADATTVDLHPWATGGPLRLVGNLPYNISTPLLFHFTGQAARIRDMHFMLQREVVDRMAAGPGSKTYGRLSVMLQYRCRVEPLFRVPAGAFRPAPKVESTVVRLRPHTDPPVPVADEARLETVVRHAFATRRKTLSNALKGVVDAEGFAAADVDPRARAETLDLAAFARLASTPAPDAAPG